MLQRIQTLYILLAILCLLVGFFVPAFIFHPTGTEGAPISIYTCRMETGDMPIIGASVMLAGWSYASASAHTLALLLAAFALISYKKRPLQIRLLSLVNLFAFLTLGLSSYLFVKFSGSGSQLLAGLHLGAALLIATVLFNLFAINNIRRDEKLVRSMDRLR